MIDLNLRSEHLIADALARQTELGISAHSIEKGGTLIDFGVNVDGSLAAGIILARICMADLAECRLVFQQGVSNVLPPMAAVQVQTDHPVLSCLASQYAGWEFKLGDFFSMVSGPGRWHRKPAEKVIQEIREIIPSGLASNEANPQQIVLVMETRKLPADLNSLFQSIGDSCGVDPARVTVCVAPTASTSGLVQIVARSVETAVHKLHELDFPLSGLRAGQGTALIPPTAGDDLQCLGWTNDCVLYGSQVQLWVDAHDHWIEEFGPQIPSCSSADFGQPFLNTFKNTNYNFYEIDPLLFSPAEIVLINERSGRIFHFGQRRPDILANSFGFTTDNATK